MNDLVSLRLMNQVRKCLAVCLISTGLGCVSPLSTVRAQGGGSYDLSLTVIASGGGSNSVRGIYSIDGTTGQAAAGVSSTSGNYGNNSGFWAFNIFDSNAATVTSFWTRDNCRRRRHPWCDSLAVW